MLLALVKGVGDVCGVLGGSVGEAGDGVVSDGVGDVGNVVVGEGVGEEVKTVVSLEMATAVSSETISVASGLSEMVLATTSEIKTVGGGACDGVGRRQRPGAGG